MDTKIFIGIPLDHLLKEELQNKEHGLLITLKEGKEYLGLRSQSSKPSIEELMTLREELLHQINTLSFSFLVDLSQLSLFPEVLIG